MRPGSVCGEVYSLCNPEYPGAKSHPIGMNAAAAVVAADPHGLSQVLRRHCGVVRGHRSVSSRTGAKPKPCRAAPGGRPVGWCRNEAAHCARSVRHDGILDSCETVTHIHQPRCIVHSVSLFPRQVGRPLHPTSR